MKRQTNICGGKLHSPVNCSNEEQMIAEGLRVPLREKISFKKTEEERNALRSIPTSLRKSTPWNLVTKVEG